MGVDVTVHDPDAIALPEGQGGERLPTERIRGGGRLSLDEIIKALEPLIAERKDLLARLATIDDKMREFMAQAVS